MSIQSSLAAGLSLSLLVLSACSAPSAAPTRAQPMPLFDKYGNGYCRPASEPISSTFPARLPTCEDVCEGRVTAGANVAICPPVYVNGRQPTTPDGGGDPGGRTPNSTRG